MNEAVAQPFRVIAPVVQSAPLVLSSPHSGAVYPEAFLAASRLDQHGLRRSEDCYVDELFASAAVRGAPLLAAKFPRAYLDLNREPYELDPRMFDGKLPNFTNVRSMRVAGGLGTIPRIVGDGYDIYRERMPVEVALTRIDTIYRPYHKALRGLLQATTRKFGEAVLLDCHSMPSASLAAESMPRADIVLGDRYGTSAAPQVMDMVQAAFERRGYHVVRNRPYAGGFITEHYGEPSTGIHALQIEINRALYMDERSLERHHDFETLKEDLDRVLQEIVQAMAMMTLTYRVQAAE